MTACHKPIDTHWFLQSIATKERFATFTGDSIEVKAQGWSTAYDTRQRIVFRFLLSWWLEIRLANGENVLHSRKTTSCFFTCDLTMSISSSWLSRMTDLHRAACLLFLISSMTLSSPLRIMIRRRFGFSSQVIGQLSFLFFSNDLTREKNGSFRRCFLTCYHE